jgi:hypothetical protein
MSILEYIDKARELLLLLPFVILTSIKRYLMGDVYDYRPLLIKTLAIEQEKTGLSGRAFTKQLTIH